jgi:hypothetical protein
MTSKPKKKINALNSSRSTFFKSELMAFVVLAVSVLIYYRYQNSSPIIIEKQKVPWEFLPENFTYLAEESFYTEEALQLIRDYPLEEDSVYQSRLQETKGIALGLKNFRSNPNRYSLEIRPVPGKGNGCFAMSEIPANTIIGEYKGIVTTEHLNDLTYAWNFLPSDSEFVNTPLHEIFIDSQTYGDGWLRY